MKKRDSTKSVSFVNLSGESMALSSEEILSRRLNSWKGWFCSAGRENLYISHDGNVYVATCKVGGVKGNVFDCFFPLQKKWTRCAKERCMCGQDMQLRKARTEDLILKTNSVPSEQSTVNHLTHVDWVVPYHFETFLDFPKFVTWDLGRRCNYSCDYCHPSISNTYEAHKSWGSLKYAADNIEVSFLRGAKAKWVFTGGEPTINPSFMNLIKYLREKGHNLHTQTNGSRTPNYYAELIEYSSVGISLHLKYYQEKSFLKTCQAVIDQQQGEGRARYMWFGIRIMVPPKMLKMALEIKHKILSLPRFESFQNIHLSPLYKTELFKIDEMIEYDKEEYDEIIAHT